MRNLTRTAARRRLRSLFRRGRTPGLRTAKTTVAAVISFVIAQRLGTSPQPLLAPLTALLVVQLTLYETLSHGLQRVASVSAGVLVAVVVATFVGLTWWSLGTVIAVSIILGRLLRLGPYLLEVPISAMLVLAVGGAQDVPAARARVAETLIGAIVGMAVNAVIAPPLYVQPAGDALADLAERMAEVMRELAEQLRRGWSREAATHWLAQARALGTEVERADRTIGRAEESARFNPRGAHARDAQPRLRTGLTGLEHSQITLRSLCRSLLDRTYFVPEEEETTVYSADVRGGLADVLVSAANAVDRVVAVTSEIGPADQARTNVSVSLAELQRRIDRLREMLGVTPQTDEGAWQQHGALLATVDRLRVEVEAAVRPPDTTWRPPPSTERQAVSRLLAAGTESLRGTRHRRRRP